MATIAELAVKLGLNSKEFEKGTKEVDKKSGKLKKTLGNVAKAAAGVTAGAAAVGAGMFAMANKVTETGDRIHKASQRMGISSDALQEMEYWASQNGLAQEQLEKAVGRLNQRMGMAANGNDKYAEAMERLGISVDDVRNGTITTEDAFAKSIQTLSQMTNEHEKAELATEMFGVKLARDLLPSLNDGSLSLEDAAAKARELGMVMDEDAVNASAKFQDTIDDLKRTMGGMFRDIAMSFLPILQTFLDWIQKYLPVIRSVFSIVFEKIKEYIGIGVEWIQNIIRMMQEWFKGSQTSLNDIWGVFKHYLTYVLDYWKFIFEQIWIVVKTILDMLIPFVQEQLEKIRQFWDENGEEIMEAVQIAFAFIQKIIETVMPILQHIIKAVWNNISGIIEAALGIIMGLIKTVTSAIRGDWEGFGEGLKQIWESIWGAIKNFLESVWMLLRPVFKTLWNSIKDWFIGLKDDALQWGRNMIDGFIEGIRDKIAGVGQAARDVVSAAGDFIKFWSPAKKGEGRFIEDWGANMIDGFLDGVRGALPDVQSLMRQVIPDLSANFQPSIAGAQGINRTENNVTNRFTFTGPVNMRDENDVKILARELNDLQQGKGRSEGDA